MEFRRATQKDLDYVRQNPFEGAVKDYPYMQIPDENCITTIFESHIVAVAGLVMKWPGVGELWMMLTADCKKHGFFGLFALTAIQEKMEWLIEANKLWRVQAIVRLDFPQAIKMIEYFGFKRDCKMEKYLPDKTDAYLYSRIV